MISLLLNENWSISSGKNKKLSDNVPCSLCSALLNHGVIENPLFGTNEKKIQDFFKEDCIFEKEFNISDKLLKYKNCRLTFNGIDTLADVELNGVKLGSTDDMHCTWNYDVNGIIRAGVNKLCVKIKSPIMYINEEQKRYPLWGSAYASEGFSHIRKAHYMFGWDWGVRIPDMGIFKDVELICSDCGIIENVYVRQIHKEGKVNLKIKTEVFGNKSDNIPINVLVISPDKTEMKAICFAENGVAECEITIENPELWWPRGYGNQPLYTVTVSLNDTYDSVISKSLRIGLRELTVSREKDEWGREFCFVINGVKIFSMGANWIPTDAVLQDMNPGKTAKLLEMCADANFNTIRIWGGGIYATDDFIEKCDELGIIVWQDFMFACSTYILDSEHKKELLIKEFSENIKRLRNHASLGLLCGNNEVEIAIGKWRKTEDERVKADYLVIFEEMLPKLINELCPDIFYWPSSPSTNGGYDDPNNENSGDVHYWTGEPMEVYRDHYFRYCSEMGFSAFPDIETVKAYAEGDELDPFSETLINHQKYIDGNRKIMNEIFSYYRYPQSIEWIVYASQLLQADTVRYAAEHFRSNRGRCMGLLYWMSNDCWPVASWAGIDYFGRAKALHYKAKRFYAPILLSVCENGTDIALKISSESNKVFDGKIKLGIYRNDFSVISQSEISVSADAFTASEVFHHDFSNEIEDIMSNYFCCKLYDKHGNYISQQVILFVKPQVYSFAKPDFTYNIEGDVLKIKSSCFAKDVAIGLGSSEYYLSDNYFDITDSGETSIKIKTAVDKTKLLQSISIMCVNNLGVGK